MITVAHLLEVDTGLLVGIFFGILVIIATKH